VLSQILYASNRNDWWMGLATRSAATEHVFKPFLQNGRLDPRRMRANEMLSLMVGLAQVGLSRKLAAAQAA